MSKQFLKLAIVSASVIGFSIYAYRDYQHRAVAHYLNSGQVDETMRALGWTTNRSNDFLIMLESRDVLIRAKANTKDEFERMLQVAARPGRPSVEHVVIYFQNGTYTQQ